MNVKRILYGLVAVASMSLTAKDKDIPQHLQDISVTIVSEGEWSKGEGSGVVFTRKDKDGNVSIRVMGKSFVDIQTESAESNSKSKNVSIRVLGKKVVDINTDDFIEVDKEDKSSENS